MIKTRLSIPKMDCAAEERLVRMALDGRAQVHRVQADLSSRELLVLHDNDPDDIAAALRPLNFGAKVLESGPVSALDESSPPSSAEEARTLRIVLAINATMFVAEAMAGLLIPRHCWPIR